jgi:hypothetical protein
LIDPNQANRPVDESLLTGTADEVEVTGIDPTTSVFYNGGFMGTEKEQQEIANMYPGSTTPIKELKDSSNYEVTFTDIGKIVEVPSIFDPFKTETIWVTVLYPKPNGDGGITLQWVTFNIKNLELGWLIREQVNLKLTYPDGTTKNISDSAYVLPISENYEETIASPPYSNYNKLNPDEFILTESIFQVEKFFTDWFTKDSFQNGLHKLEVTWTYQREVTEGTLKFDTTKKVGDIVIKDYKETIEFDLYNQDYVSNDPI